MIEMLEVLRVPLILFVVVVVPLWIIQHYRHKAKAVRQSEEAADADFKRLADSARRLEDRVSTLEQILDKEAPGWRSR